jgi:putative membrane protein
MIEYDTKRWAQIVFRVHGSVLPRIAGRVVSVVLVAGVLTFGQLALAWNVPTSRTLHALVGVALGLLLVFRTNSSYDRFWEGRILIGAMVNNTRDLARQTASYLSDSPEAVRHRVGHYIIALFATIRRSLRREREAPELDALLSSDERAELVRTSAPPLLVARWLSDQLAAEAKAGRLPEERLRMIDGGISDLIDHWGGAERILKTPVPFAYAHHIKGFLMIFCLTAPLALLETMGWYTPIGAAIIAYGLYGIDEIGIEIEEPFGYDVNDLPMDGIGETIARNVSDILGLQEDRVVPEPQLGKAGVYQ